MYELYSVSSVDGRNERAYYYRRFNDSSVSRNFIHSLMNAIGMCTEETRVGLKMEFKNKICERD